jgi:hypothetical protein
MALLHDAQCEFGGASALVAARRRQTLAHRSDL